MSDMAQKHPRHVGVCEVDRCVSSMCRQTSIVFVRYTSSHQLPDGEMAGRVQALATNVSQPLETVERRGDVGVMAVPPHRFFEASYGHGSSAEMPHDLLLDGRQRLHDTSVHAHAMPANHADAPAMMPPGVHVTARMETTVAPRTMTADARMRSSRSVISTSSSASRSTCLWPRSATDTCGCVFRSRCTGRGSGSSSSRGGPGRTPW